MQFAASLFLCGVVFAQAPQLSITRMRADLTFLCTPELQGRTSLERGADIAASYIAAEFAKAGLAPIAGSQYFQEFALIEPMVDAASGSLVLVRNGQRETIRYGTAFRGSFRDDVSVAAPAAFAGYGITAPEYGYDDYAGLDARGKVVIVFAHEPQEGDPKSVFRGAGLTRYATPRVKTVNAQAHGVVAILIAPEPKSTHEPPPAPPSAGQAGRGGVTRGFAPSQSDEAVSIPSFTISEATAEKLLGRATAELQQAIDASLKPSSMVVPDTTIEIRMFNKQRRRAMSRNVIGLLEGSDPALARETILVTSHYDHLPNRGESYYPGANDNASGTVAVIELARVFAASAQKPKRSLLFVSFGSEEEGLLGSYYYTAHPVRPIETTRAVINLDMIARDEAQVPATERYIKLPPDTSNEINLVGGSYSPDLVAAIQRANERVGFALNDKYDHDSSQNVLFRCDHFPFLLKDVPAVWLFAGFHPGYHEPSDTVDRLNFAKLEKVARLAWGTVWELDGPAPPRFVAK